MENAISIKISISLIESPKPGKLNILKNIKRSVSKILSNNEFNIVNDETSLSPDVTSGYHVFFKNLNQSKSKSCI